MKREAAAAHPIDGAVATAVGPDDAPLVANRKVFICGVVEGFYGRPWTTEQRKDLFAKMNAWDMTSYLYAPKDDCKHRAYWRELYTVEEAEHLQSLVALAAECNIDFYYAISPGLDIVYSNSKEVACLKRKLEQVSQLGCKSFALLFDDIEPEMCKQDKEVFQSFAHAQVTITNDIYEHLGQPHFLFCPTQYCTARAVPSIRNSEYLNTIGAKLSPDINVMWTGDKVISKQITLKSLEEITDVLRRPVVVWDNEHANDYDQKRVFLGPYSGRSPEVISKLNGVMTNPNCEYGANFVAIHTLAQWSKCSIDGTQPYSAANETVSADIKLEIQDADSDDCNPSPVPVNVYHPRNALVVAIKDWIPEFYKQKTVWGPMSKPQVGLTVPTPQQQSTLVNTCMSATGTTKLVNSIPGTTVASSVTESSNKTLKDIPVINGEQVNLPLGSTVAGPELPPLSIPPPTVETPEGACSSSILQPVSMPVMNSLVARNKVVVDHSLINSTASSVAVSSAPATGSASAMVPTTANTSVMPVCSGDEDTPMAVQTPPQQTQTTPVAAATAAATTTAVAATNVAVLSDQLSTSSATGSLNSLGTVVPNVVPPDVIPGPTYLEPMDCHNNPAGSPALSPAPVNPTPAGDGLDVAAVAAVAANSHVAGISPKLTHDVQMETNPPTPASGMQVESEPGMHKAESTTMLCDPSGSPPRATPAEASAGDGSERTDPVSSSGSGANPADGPSTLVPTQGENITNNPEVTTMLCDEVCTDIKEVDNPRLTVKDLVLLCQLFYLPSAHGKAGLCLLDDFFWLKRNATTMLPPGTPGSGSVEERAEWETRAAAFKQIVSDIQTLFVKLCSCQNRELVYDLYTYVWDMCSVVQTLEGFVQWLSKGACSHKAHNYVVGQQTWFSGIREAFLSGEHEPWMFRGGLVSDLQRLLPLDSGHDLYQYKFPDVPAPLLFYVRPFQPKDEDAVYALAADAYEETIEAPMGLCPADRILIGDKEVGPYLTLCPEFSFVCENSLDGSIVGYACAAPDAKTFYNRYNMAWLPEMRLKYPASKAKAGATIGGSCENGSTGEELMLTPLEQIAQSFHSPGAEATMPSVVVAAAAAATAAASTASAAGSESTASASAAASTAPWGVAHMRVATSVTEPSLTKRLTMLLLASLRASGTFRLFVDGSGDRRREFYSNLGFSPMASAGVGSAAGDNVAGGRDETSYMNRSF